MSNDGSLLLLLLGPAGAAGLYWTLYQHYRNTDKSHAFERETSIDAQPVTGQDEKIDHVEGTQRMEVDGENVQAYRQRVRRHDHLR